MLLCWLMQNIPTSIKLTALFVPPKMRNHQLSSPQRADSHFSISKWCTATRSTKCLLQAPLLLQEEAR